MSPTLDPVQQTTSLIIISSRKHMKLRCPNATRRGKTKSSGGWSRRPSSAPQLLQKSAHARAGCGTQTGAGPEERPPQRMASGSYAERSPTHARCSAAAGDRAGSSGQGHCKPPRRAEGAALPPQPRPQGGRGPLRFARPAGPAASRQRVPRCQGDTRSSLSRPPTAARAREGGSALLPSQPHTLPRSPAPRRGYFRGWRSARTGAPLEAGADGTCLVPGYRDPSRRGGDDEGGRKKAARTHRRPRR